jgi:hypothetical protein
LYRNAKLKKNLPYELHVYWKNSFFKSLFNANPSIKRKADMFAIAKPPGKIKVIGGKNPR